MSFVLKIIFTKTSILFWCQRLYHYLYFSKHTSYLKVFSKSHCKLARFFRHNLICLCSFQFFENRFFKHVISFSYNSFSSLYSSLQSYAQVLLSLIACLQSYFLCLVCLIVCFPFRLFDFILFSYVFDSLQAIILPPSRLLASLQLHFMVLARTFTNKPDP